MQFFKSHSRISVLIFAFLLFHNTSFSQCAISGRIIDSTKTPVPFGTLALLNHSDSSVYKGTITDENGKFCFTKVKSGTYLLKVSAVGFAVKIGSPMKFDSSSTNTIPDIVIHSQIKNLKEFSIAAIRDPIEFKNGNIIVNIEDSPLAVGNSAYDLLAQLPGVAVEDDKISIDGNTGVQIFIDGRMQQLSGQQLINYLRGINSSDIEKIEILKNPPAKYDAAGTAGIINIKTKKLKMTGFSGSANYTLSQGINPFHYAGLNLNYKGNKVAVFSNVDFSGGNLQFVDNLYSEVTYNSVTTFLNSKSAKYDKSVIPTYNLGMDWYIDKRNTIGIKLQDSYAGALRSQAGTTLLSDNSLGYEQLGFNSAVKNDWNYFNGNINAEHLFDTLGTSLKFSTDYYSTLDIYHGNYANNYSDNSGIPTLPSKDFISNNTINTQILASKLDFEKTLSKTLSLEAGVKSSYQKITNDYILQDKSNLTGNYSTDSLYTNIFSYEEKIAASYFNLKKEIKNVNLQVGFRGENTDVHAEGITSNFNFDHQYFKIFSVISLDYRKSVNSVFQLSYNSRINRPDYNSYSPYKSFVNILTTNIGNPYLMPAIHHVIKFTHTYKKKILNSFFYRRASTPFFQNMIQNDSTKEIIFQVNNLKSSDIIGYSLFIRTDVYKWWSLTFNSVANYVDYTGAVNGFDYSASSFTYRGYLNNQIILPKKYKIEVTANYSGPQLSELSHIKSRSWLNIAIKKSFLKEKMNLTIGIEDIFKTGVSRNNVNFQNVNYNYFEYNDSRRLKISLSYSFGKIKVEQREVSEADTEQQRLAH